MSVRRPPSSDLQRFVPRYHEIEQALRTRIVGLQPNDPLPSDAQLCEEFGVSRMTARNAVARLAQEGIVYRVPGRGTFVAEPPVHRQASSLLSFSEEMRRKGRTPTSHLLEQVVRPADLEERLRMRLDPDAEIVLLTRLRIADDIPVAIERAAFSAALASDLMAADLEDGSLHGILLRLGRVPTAGTASLSAAGADTREAKLLQVRRGAPLLVERRLIFDQGGTPLELTESRYAANRYGLEVSFDVELVRD